MIIIDKNKINQSPVISCSWICQYHGTYSLRNELKMVVLIVATNIVELFQSILMTSLIYLSLERGTATFCFYSFECDNTGGYDYRIRPCRDSSSVNCTVGSHDIQFFGICRSGCKSTVILIILSIYYKPEFK